MGDRGDRDNRDGYMDKTKYREQLYIGVAGKSKRTFWAA